MAVSRGFKQFARRLRTLDRLIGKRFGANVRKAGTVALRTAIFATPVDTGRARANWSVSFGNPVTETTKVTDQGGEATLQKGASIIATHTPLRGPIILSNNVEYIVPLDQGSSAQAPEGMSQQAIQAAAAVLRQGRVLRS